MLKSYFKVALRSLARQRGFAFINIMGLAIGLTCFTLIGLFVRYELSYDRHNEKADRIYRVVNEVPELEFMGSDSWARTPAPLVEALTTEVPEVEAATQIAHARALLEFGEPDESGESGFYEDGIFASPGLSDVFTLTAIRGNVNGALTDPGSIVLTQSLAEKYFGTSDVVGRTLTVSYVGELFDGAKDMVVTAVVEDPPSTSHFSFSFAVPIRSAQEYVDYIDRWDSNSFLTYVALRPGTSPDAFGANLAALGQRHLGQLEFYQNNPDRIGRYQAQALTDIHLRSDVNGEFQANGDIRYVVLFSAIALLVLLIACVNYVNLVTARSATRAMEVGVRKVMGARRQQLFGQFMSEAIVPAILALAAAVVLAHVLLPTFNELTGRSIVIDPAKDGLFLAALLGLGLIAGVLAGTYPAVVLTAMQPVGMMKGILGTTKGKTRLRNALVVTQFAITTVLIIGAIVIERQLGYIQSANTGVDREQVVSIEIEDQLIHERYPALKQQLLQLPNVIAVTAAQGNPTNIDSATPVREWEGGVSGDRVQVYRSAIRHDYLDVFGLELVEGTDFSEDRLLDAEEGVLINETAMRQFGWETAVGKSLNLRGRTRVIGVVKDFTFHSFHHEVAPLVFTLEGGSWFPYQRVFVKVGPDNVQQTIAAVGETMRAVSPEYPFVYSFLDDAYQALYQRENQLGRLMTYFTLLALFVACLGLLGLASYVAQQRTKEIGVRKVLGATLGDILVMLTKDFTRLVLIGFVIAAPLGYFAVSGWLSGFSYRVGVGPGTFLLAAGMLLLLAWATVSYQSLRAALADPVDSLRWE